MTNQTSKKSDFQNKPFLLITGMHRSGTSFAARAFNLMGVYMGDLGSLLSHEWNHMDDNLRGHWENKEFYELGEKTLLDNKGSWHEVPAQININKELGLKINHAIQNLLKHPSIASGYKDPRSLLYFDAWHSYLPQDTIIIGIFRHPLKVAESLKKRNNFTYDKSLKLWKEYNKRLLAILDKNKGFLIDFDWPKEKLLSEIQGIGEKLGLVTDINLSEWHSDELLHSTIEKNYPIDNEIQELYSQLKNRSENNHSINLDKVTHPNSKIIVSSLLKEIQSQGKEFKIINDINIQKIKTLTEKLQEYETKETTGPIGKLLFIYLNRPDLQSAFPEVSTGDYDKLIGWAAGVLEGKYKDDQVSSTLSKFGSWYKEQSSKLQVTNEINKLNELVSGLNKKIEEQKTAFDEITKSLADEKQRAIGLENTVTGLNRSLADEKQRAIGLNDQLEGTKDRLESLLGSPGWQFIIKFRNSYNKYFPPSTKRRRNMDSLISSVIKKLNNQNIKSIEKSSYHENIVQNQTIKSSNKEEFDKNNISDEDLLAIYNRRDDLQNKYPEVKQKNDFAGLRGWYHAYGIKEIIRLKTDNTDYGEYDKWKNATRNILVSGSKQKITNKHPKITIIVTVHNHANVVIPCIESVLKWTSMPYDLLIVDDASTEQELLQYLEKISKLSSVQVVHNETNLGYLVSVNNAIKSTSSDVLLLNSDTIVTRNWLDKMYSCAYSNDKISTVSPLSNNATLCSVPEFMKPNKIPDGMTIDSFAETVEKVSEYSYPIISTCVGFCMYIKRNVIEKIGLFDEVFSPGYEEENDFCMRAYKAGFVSVLDDSTFIFHIGRSSFQEQTSRLEKDHMKLILKKHPEYLTIVSGFSGENPLQRIQERIKKAIIKVDRTKFKNVLMVLHRPVYAQNPGGTEDFCRMLYEGIDGFAKYLLYAADNNVIVVEENAPSGRRVLYRFKRGDVIPGNVACNKSEEEFFSSILDELNIGLVHFHHLLYLPLNFFHIVKNKGLEAIISIHDFYYMCPRIYLFEKGEYNGFCNACVDLDRCDRCLKMIGYEKGFQNIWRRECQKMLERADLIITPTKSTLELYKKVYQIDWSKAKIIEHGIKTAELFSNFSSPEPPAKTMKVGFIGAVKTDRKGKDIILDLLRLDKNNNIEWHFFGRDSNLTELIKSRNIKPVGKIVNHDGWDKSESLPSLLHETGIHIIIIPSQECYSIVLSEVWAAHIPVIVPNLVALGDRVNKDTPGWTYPFPSPAEEILALLNKIFMNPKMYAEKTARFKTLQVRPAQDCIREYQGIYNKMLNT